MLKLTVGLILSLIAVQFMYCSLICSHFLNASHTLQPNAPKKNDPSSYVHYFFLLTALLLDWTYVYTAYAQPIAAQCYENPSEHSLEGRSSYTRLVVE